MKKFYSAVSLLLVLTLLLSCVGPVYAAEPTKATGSAYNEMIVGDWLFTDTIVNRGTNGAALIMKDYAAAGVTDVYLLCKGIAGRVAWATKVTGAVRSSSTRDYLKEACDAAKPYGIRVHAWMMASRDTHYVTNIDSNSPCYHFRVGTSNSVNQYINLRDTGYRNYMTALVKELVANYDIAGIHLDTIRYGALYYDWGLNARTELMNNYGMTKAEWNAATKAMCVTGGYSYTTNADGYYVYSSSGTTATGVSLSGALAGNGSTDALNGAKKIAQFRKDNITNFVKVIRSAAGSNKVISCAIMPETCTSSYESMLYGQSPEGLGSVVDYVAVMAYSSEYVQPSSWPTTLVKACTAVGCRAIAGIQTYPSEGSSDPDPNGQIIFDETYGIRKAMLTDSSIRGYAFFRGSFTDLAGAKYIDANTVDITVAPGDDAASATKYVFTLQNGMTCNSISNKSGWASGTSFSISSDKKTITISNGGSTILSKNSSASFRMAVSGTVDETLGIAKLRSYRTSSYTEGYGYCGTLMPKHTHEYTASITTAATCAKEGVKTYTCNCGHSYTEPIAKTAHDYTAATGSNGVTTYTCKVCKTSFSTTCGDTHSNIETWVLADKMHRTICYDCKQGVTEKCVFEELTRVDPTATADGYVTYICVGSASISKSVSHDAFSGKGCGRTYNVTLPKGTEYTYTNAGNGTHTRTGVDSDVTETNLSHSYVNGVCACGEPERNFIQLHFNDNSVANKLGYWSVNSVRGSIHTANSSFAGVAYGTDPYISMLHTGDVLHYQIKSGDIVEVRIKAKILSGTTTNAQFFYTTTADKKYSEAKSVVTNYSQTPNGEYQILRFNLNKDVGAFINALRLDPFGGNSANFRANFEIDYIYVGSANHAPSAQTNSIFMDFTNDSRAAARYLTSDVYGGFNYDQKHWYYNAKRSAKPAIDAKAGTMTLTIAPTTDNYSSTGVSPYIQTADLSMSGSGTPLNYVPKTTDVVQMRVKFENCALIEGGKARIRLYFIKNGDDGSAGVDASDYITIVVDEADLSSGKWVTYTTNVGSTFGSASSINALRPMFNTIRSADGKTGKITIDYIYVGASEAVPEQKSLMFDFNNSADDQLRYSSNVYGNVNFDRPQNWYYYQDVNVSKFAIDNANGTMNVDAVGELDATKYPCIYMDTVQNSNYHTYPLNFDPANAEVYQVRFKMENFTSGVHTNADGKEVPTPPYVTLSYFIDGVNTTHSACEAAKFDVSYLTSGEYLTVTVNLNDEFRAQDRIEKLRVFFGGIESISATKLGKLTVDFIYIGPKATLPVQNALYMNFGNTQADKDRYSSRTYGEVNFDRPENWYYYQDVNVSKFAIDNAKGTMNVDAVGELDATKYPCIYMDTVQNSSYHTYPLNFDPANAEVYQVRFKMENFTYGVYTNADGKEIVASPYVTLSYFIDGVNKTHSACEAAKFDVSYLTSGEYLTMTVNLNDEFRAQDRIEKIRVFFGGIESISEATPGKLTVDFVYIGPKATLPVQDALYMNFGNTQTDKDRYNSRTYGEVNFDRPENWYYYQDVNVSKFAIDNAKGTMNVDAVGVLGTTKYPCIYMDTVQNSSYHTYPLHYVPANAEVYQVRFKMENFTYGVYTNADGKEIVSSPYVSLSYFINGVNETHSAGEAAKFDVSYLTSGQYLTMTVNLNDVFRGEEHIDKIRFFFGGIESISEATPGKLTIDYFYIGPKAGMPQKEYTVTFVDANGKTLQTQKVAAGQTAKYTGATPTKAYDATNHYTFKGWDKALSNIQGNITVTAQFTATAHTLTYAKVDGTNHKGTCSCGYSKTAAHAWDAGKVTTAATCANTGVKTYTCSTCKATKTETIAKVPHSYTSKVTTAATCTKAGVKTFTCSKCSHSYTEAIAATGHTVVTDKAVAATCTTAGKTEGTHCSVCNTVLVAQKTVAALGHSYRYTDNGNGTHTVTCSRCSYKATQTHSFTNGTCVCGGTTVTVDESIKIYHTLDLASDISITFAVPQSALANYESYYLECILPEYEGNKLTGTSTVKVEPTVSGSYYYFTLSGITAVRMGDMVEATLHMTRGTAQYTSKTDSYSVATYAYAMLNSSKDAKMLTLCADLLRYGAEAQTYKKYRTDSLVDGAMTTAHKTYLSSTDTLQFTFTDSSLGDLANPKITWVGKTLDLGSKVGMKFVFNTANYTGDIAKLSMKVSYVGSNGETKTVTLTGAEVYSAANKYYSFTFYGLLASELRTIVDVAIYEGNTRLSETLRYSAESYASRNTGGALAPLCKALFAYSDSAKAFFAK